VTVISCKSGHFVKLVTVISCKSGHFVKLDLIIQEALAAAELRMKGEILTEAQVSALYIGWLCRFSGTAATGDTEDAF
jgi:hypothetical protein